MIERDPKPSTKRSRANDAVQLAQRGDLTAARAAFLNALALDRHNHDLQFNLAIVEQQLGDVDDAAIRLTHLLAAKPTYPHAAARLSRLLARFQVSNIAALSSAGLAAALRPVDIAHQPIADMALRWLFQTSDDLRTAAHNLTRDPASERDIGAGLIARGTAPVLSTELALQALRCGIVKDHTQERVLTGVRAALLLDCPSQRFGDPHLVELCLALTVQLWNNDHAWAETQLETAALAGLSIDREHVLAGDVAAARAFMLHALYRPLTALVTPQLTTSEAAKLKPGSLRETVRSQLAALDRQWASASEITPLAPLEDATSLKVASQYEGAPYPRWQTLHRSTPGALKVALQRHVPADRVAFMDRPFDVLIAGSGTGQQALQSASAYGPDARLIALDLSAASLRYAADKARLLGIGTIAFVQGDILACGQLKQHFDIIECVGVLHHLADWRAGWTALLGQLKPQGLMYVGLYSATSRANVRRLRSQDGYPGPGCSDAAARSYRRELMMQDAGHPGFDLKLSQDFYALHAFRDLALHESEAHVSLPDIQAFLAANGLTFCGFTIEPQVASDFAKTIGGPAWPGTLAQWDAYEQAHPRTFDAMYRFWVTRQN
jgi:SAM-dependent methyltransferase/tetratricopeptide (TPR) repeat protein